LQSTAQEKSARYSVFSIGGKLFCLEISVVVEVLKPPRVTKLPNMTDHVLGVYNLRGNIITLLDIGGIMGLPSETKDDTEVAILIGRDNHNVSFIVNQILDFVEIDSSAIRSAADGLPGELRNFVNGSYQHQKLGQLYLLDTGKLLKSEKLFEK
jgi:chemotaxis signal transduction protein